MLRTLLQVTGVDGVGIMRQIPFLTRGQAEGKQKTDAGHVVLGQAAGGGCNC